MTYWFTDAAVKDRLPLSGASAIRGMSIAFSMPRLFMGPNALSEVRGGGANVFETVGLKCAQRRAFVVTDEHAGRYANRVCDAMQRRRFTTEVWDKAQPEAPLENVRECAEAMSEFGPDAIVALGGGSVIDGAKAAWILYERPDITDLATVPPLRPFGLREKAVFVAIPTTSGTGSDCTAVAVVSDTKAKRKIPIVNGDLLPDFSILVPDLVSGMPPHLTAGTGLDALAHSMDCVTSPMTNDFTDAMALRAIQMIFKYLPRAYHDGADHEARLRMHIAASMAGIAFGNGGVALTHSLGHSLGKLFAIHHGIAVGVLIPYVFQYYSTVTDKYLDICDALNIRGDTDEERFIDLIEKVRALFTELDVPLSLKGLGISEKDFEDNFDKLAIYSVEDPSAFQSPRSATQEQCEKLFRYAYEGKDIDF